jgi:cytolysin-activating lysine-acyltransferase
MDRRAEQMGLVASLMCRSASYRRNAIAYLRLWIEPAISHRQIHFAFDEKGKPIAFWTWALLAPDVEHRLIHKPAPRLHESEWNEGDHLWIMDFTSQPEYVRDIVGFMRHSLFTQYQQARSIRRNPDGSLRKVSVWRQATSPTRGHGDVDDLLFHLPASAYAPSYAEWASIERDRLAKLRFDVSAMTI